MPRGLNLLLLAVLLSPLKAAVTLQVVPDTVKIRPGDRPAGSPEAMLALCRGEVGSFQVAATAGRDDPVTAFSVEPFDLAGDAAKLSVTANDLFWQHLVEVERPSGGRSEEWAGLWPEALIPLPFAREPRLLPDQTRAWWVDLRVPAECPPGRYVGRCPVILGDVRTELPVTVDVLDITLPVTRHVRANVAVYYDDILLSYANQHWRSGGEQWTTDDPEYGAIKAAYYELLLEHRLCAYELPVPMTSPAAERYYRDPRVHSIRLPWSDDQGSAKLRAAVEAATTHGCHNKLYYYAADEPPPAAWPSVIAAADQVAEAAPGVPFVVTLAPVERLLGKVQVWCPNLADFMGIGYLDTDRLAVRRAAGEETWWYTCCVPTAPYPTWLVDDDAVAPRATIWMMAKYGLTGFVYSMAHGWGPDPYRSIASYLETNGDGLLLYPGQAFGTAAPFPSIRLKLLRAGLQDYELLRLLAGALDQATSDHVGSPSGWDLVGDLVGAVVAEPHTVRRDPAILASRREEALQAYLAATHHGLAAWLADGQLTGVVTPGRHLTVDGQPLAVDAAGRWSTPLGSRAVAVLTVGDPALTVTRHLPDGWPPPLPELAVEAPLTTSSIQVDGHLDEPDWTQAGVVALADGSVFRLLAVSDGLAIGVTGADRAIAVIDPARRHREVYTFSFDQQPRRGVRRTEEGRDPDYQPEWQAAGGSALEALIPWPALGRAPTGQMEEWGLTLISHLAAGRTFWRDHLGDLRRLPTLRIRAGAD